MRTTFKAVRIGDTFHDPVMDATMRKVSDYQAVMVAPPDEIEPDEAFEFFDSDEVTQ